MLAKSPQASSVLFNVDHVEGAETLQDQRVFATEPVSVDNESDMPSDRATGSRVGTV